MNLNSNLTLLKDPYTPKDVISWYSSSLLTENQLWLSKTIKQATLFRVNVHGLPWDVDENNGKIVSSLPETVIKQMNTFLDLSDSIATKFAFSTTSRYQEIQNRGKEDSSELDTKIDQLRDKIQLEMVRSSNTCLILLAEEFQNALQIKNWSRSTGITSSATYALSDFSKERMMAIKQGDLLNVEGMSEEEANFLFLVSMANDCERVIIHIDNDSVVKGDGGFTESQQERVTEFYRQTAYLVSLQIYRVIFADVHDILLNFREKWSNQSSLATKNLIYAMSSYFDHLKYRLDSDHVSKNIVMLCSNLCAGCFILMIKERAAKEKKFVGNELSRLHSDVGALQSAFNKYTNRSDDRESFRTSMYGDNSEKRVSLNFDTSSRLEAIMLLEDILQIITTPYPIAHSENNEHNSTVTEEPLEKLVDIIIASFDAFVSRELINCALSLRQTTNKKILSYVDDALETVKDKPNLMKKDDKLNKLLRNMFDNHFKQIVPSLATAGSSSSLLKQFRESAADTFSGIDSKSRENTIRFLKLFSLENSDTKNNDWSSNDDNEGGLMGVALSSMSSAGETVVLQITKLEVRGVSSGSLFSKANPYVAVNVAETKERCKTSVIWGATNGSASWGKQGLSIKHSRAGLSQGYLEIEVNDKERLRRKSSIGRVFVKLGGKSKIEIEGSFSLLLLASCVTRGGALGSPDLLPLYSINITSIAYNH